MKNKVIKEKEANRYFNQLGDEFVVIPNPDYIFPSYEVVPLAEKIEGLKDLKAVVMDMDGTTTTTEELCIHSLEFMVRKITNRLTKEDWAGLDHIKDYPQIIGNSTTKHIEYLINTYGKQIDKDALISSYIYAALWTLLIGQDEGRKIDVTTNINNLGLGGILVDKKLVNFRHKENLTKRDLTALNKSISARYSNLFAGYNFNDYVTAAIDIYYQRYHEILLDIKKGTGNRLAETLLGSSEKHLIEPMAGVGIFLSLISGLLGEEVKGLLNHLFNLFYADNSKLSIKEINNIERNIVKLAIKFQKAPVKVAVVTSSIFYEADIVLTEVFKVIHEDIEKNWQVSTEKKKLLLEKFKSYNNFYDAFVTASDSNEIRLKPHRDLYSIALQKLGITKKDFDKVIGLEDSESGTISIRAAGIGLCAAVPFAKTKGHNLDAATYIAPKGLPEIILKHNLFLK